MKTKVVVIAFLSVGFLCLPIVARAADGLPRRTRIAIGAKDGFVPDGTRGSRTALVVNKIV